MTATVRRAHPGDEHDILRLVHALAAYERAPEAVEATPEALASALFREHPKVFAHVAERDGQVVGMSVWFFNYSTWTGRHGIYLEDLFVDPEVRGGGIARALFDALGIPRQVIVDDQIAELEVDTLGRRLGSNQDRSFVTKILHQRGAHIG